MRWIMAFSFLTLAACTNAVPEVSQLETPSIVPPPVPSIQNPYYADASTAGAQTVSSVDAYTAKVVVHGGTAGKTVSSSDGYTLEVRQLSF